MKKRLTISALLLFVSVSILLPTRKVNATPNDVDKARDEYTQLSEKINELNKQIEIMDNEISQLVIEMDDNKKQIESIDQDINKVNEEIDIVKKNINDQEEVLSDRLREIYKSNKKGGYISIIFSANSLSDLISKVSATKKIVKIDNELVDNLKADKDKLDEKVELLKDKSDEIVEINEEINENKKELEAKKADEQKLLEQSKIQQVEFDAKYLAVAERELVAPLVQIINNGSSSVQDIETALNKLIIIRGQLKSPTIGQEVNDAICRGTEKINSNISFNNSRGVTVTGSKAAILDELKNHLGKSYVYGASGPDTFDCSGLTSYVYRKVTGIDIGRTTYDQIKAGVRVSKDELQEGDLVFPHTGHVGIYIGNGLMIHAPHTGDVVKIAPVYAFYEGRRILE